MKILDCLFETALMIADNKMITIIEKQKQAETSESTPTFSQAEQKLIDFYIHEFNTAVSSVVAIDFKQKSISLKSSDVDRKIDYSAFTDRVYEIESVAEKGTLDNVSFMVLPFGIYVPKASCDYFVKYSYLPEKATTLSDDIPLNLEISPRLVAYYMSSDIMLTKNLYDEAKNFRSYYENEVKRILRGTNRSRTLKMKRLL